MKSLVYLSLLCSLVACGGGSADAPAPAPAPTPIASVPVPPPAPACVPVQVRIVLPGDSTQFGIDGSIADDSDWYAARAVHNPGAELQAIMDTEFGPGNVIVEDIGVPGSTAGDASRPAIAAPIISPMYGLNDARYGVPVAQFIADMLAMHPTIIQTPYPRLDGDPLLPMEQAYIEAEKASGVPIADMNAYIRSLPNWQQYFAVPFSGHAPDALQKLVVDNVLAPVVIKQVAPLRCVGV